MRRVMARFRPPFGLLALVTLLAAGLRFYHLNSLPPGLWFDEAWVSARAREVVANGVFPLYFPAGFGGIHPLIVYLTVMARWLTGAHPLAIRYGVAAVGVLAVPLTFLALRAIFALDSRRASGVSGDWAATFGALIMTITFPTVLLSRVGFEVILPAVTACLLFWLAARALDSGRWPYYVAAGAALGFSQYAYYSARLLPAAVILAVLWVSLVARPEKRWRPAGLLGLGVAAVLVFLPLGLFFLRHPDLFGARAGTVSYYTLGPGAQSMPLAVLRNTLRTLAGFSLPGYGDALARHNIPGRPVYDVFLSILFWLGVVTLLQRWRRPSPALLGAWAGVMVLPAILTDGAPTFTRLLGAMPALAGIGGLGAERLLVALSGRWVRLGPVVLAAAFLMSAGITTTDYFARWAGDPRLFDAFQMGEWQAARLAQARATTDIVYLSPQLIGPAQPTFDLLLHGSDVKAFNGPSCLATFDRPDRRLIYLVDLLQDQETASRLEAIHPEGAVIDFILHQPTQSPLYAIFEVPAGAEVDLAIRPVAADFGGMLSLLGYTVEPAQPAAGETMILRLYWQAVSRPEADYTVFVHLYAPGEENNPPLAQSDAPPCAGAYPTSRWAAGEIVVDEQPLIIPADFSGETTVVALGLYSWPSLARLPLSATADSLSDNRLRLGELPVSK